MDTWENIKQQIKIETRDYFRPKELIVIHLSIY